MNATVPFVRTVSGATLSSSCSRIPHLNFHILRKQTRPRAITSQQDILCNRVYQRRNRSTIASLDDISQASFEESTPRTSVFLNLVEEGSRHLSQTSRADVKRESYQRSLAPVAELSERASIEWQDVQTIAEQEDPSTLLLVLNNKTIQKDFVQNASDADFERAVCALDPDVLVEPLKESYRHIHVRAARSKEGRLDFSRSMLERFKDFSSLLNALMTRRQEAGHRLTMPVCQHLLRCAGAVGDAYMANRVFTELMPELGFTANLECYNHTLTALVWNRTFGEKARFRLRGIMENFRWRGKTMKKRPSSLSGYSVSGGAISEAQTIRAQALALFRELAARGLKGDETTFTNTMIAMARAGDIAGAESILKSVWNIDLNMINTFDEEEVESPTFYDDGHPLKATEKLLFAIIHSYATNNRIKDGYKLLDYVSRNYDLPVPEQIWSDLIESAFVLTIRRSPALRKRGYAEGQISRNDFESFFDILTDEPHNMRLNALMLSFRYRVWRDWRHLDKALFSLRREKALLETSISKLESLLDAFRSTLAASKIQSKQGMLPRDLLNCRQEFLKQYTMVSRDIDMLRRDVATFLEERDFAGSGKQYTWSVRRLPELIEEFGAYLPDGINYEGPTAEMTLHTRRHRTAAIWEKWNSTWQQAEHVFGACDVEEHSALVANLQILPNTLSTLEEKCTCTPKEHSMMPHSPQHCPRKDPISYQFAEGLQRAWIVR